MSAKSPLDRRPFQLIRRRRALLAGALAGALAAAAPAFATSAAPAPGYSGVVDIPVAARADASAWPAMTSPIPRDAALEARIDALLATMTLEEKVGQTVQGDLGSVTPADLKTYRLGSVLAGGNSDPGGKYNSTGPEWLALADAFHAASMDTSGGGKAIPVLLGIDAVHGHNNVVGATLFPHNIGLGAANDVDLVRRIAAATAAELRTTGFEWTFAPTVTVPRDDRWGRTYEGYSEDGALVARYATAVVEGLQGTPGNANFLDGTHVIASSKHFIGDGGTFEGKDKGDTRVSEAELRDVHGAGHIAALRAGTQTVMASFSSWNGMKMHGNKTLLTDVLKERLGFDGFVVGDWNGHGEVPGCSNDSCAASLNAGLDMFMAPETWKAVYTHTLAQARSGAIPMARLDDAVRRILRVKFRLGLFEAPAPSQRALGGKFELLASAAHRALAREAVRKSLVLLKNDGGVLPLDPRKRLLVAGDGADDVGKQAGGWTLSWQGTGTKAADFPAADSIWAGLRAAVTAAGGEAELAVDGAYARKPDAAIVVFGEAPYAEFLGDVPNLAYQPGAARDLALLRKLKADGIPVVAVFLSGRPLWVNREINASDAFVAAWLPGSEGGGVADVLLRGADGRIAHDFSGKLSFSWPATAAQSPLNAGQPGYAPQFALGHGLKYAAPRALGALPEDSGLRDVDATPGEYFAAGKLGPGWSFELADTGAARAVTALPSGDLSPRIALSAADHRAQEDARRVVWREGPAQLRLRADAPQDLSREAMSGAALVMTLRPAAAPTGPVGLGVACAGAPCAARVPLEGLLAKAAPGQWTRVALPLTCLGKAGADLSRVEAFVLASDAPLDLALSRIVLGTEADHTVSCP
jgi:beta-glucosidase